MSGYIRRSADEGLALPKHSEEKKFFLKRIA
jgi:hypothetical protein